MVKEIVLNRDLLNLFGILLGDGSLSRINNAYFISIVGHIKDDKQFFDLIVGPLLYRLTKKNVKIRERPTQRKIEICFSNKNLFQILNSIGFPSGKKGTKITIPSQFKISEYKYIISGYFATDGCLVIANNNRLKYPRIEFSSISKPLLVQVLGYLKSIGMTGNIYVSHKYKNPSWNTLYRIQCNGKRNLEIFRNKIGFCNPKHEKKYLR